MSDAPADADARAPDELPADLLDRAAAESVRLVALHYLAQAEAARERLGASGDDEALHDFRVALRRLRSWLRAFGDELKGGVRGKLRRRLRRVARATSHARDQEVQLAWVDAQAAELRARRREGAAWLRARIAEQLDDASRELLKEVTRDFDVLEPKLTKSLSHEGRPAGNGSHAARPPFAAAVGARLRDTAVTLGARLAAVSPDAPTEPAHEARISAKRVRYVLEPIAPEIEGAPNLVSQLKQLQDVLGELHDLDVMATTLGEALAEAATTHAPAADELSPGGREERPRIRPRTDDEVDDGATDAEAEADEDEDRALDPRPGLLALARRMHDRREALCEMLDAAWLRDAGASLVGELTAIAGRLAARAAPAEPEAESKAESKAGSDGAGPPMEIERKYLLRALPPLTRAHDGQVIEQGWLPGERLVERLRCVRDADGSERYFRTVKLGTGMSRMELEEETTPALFEALWPLTALRRVRKRRFAIPDGAVTWEIDAFAGRDLVLAEVELESAEHDVQLPEWLAPYVEREVTGEDAYVNYHLARPETG